jgi:hypothetical protein
MNDEASCYDDAATITQDRSGPPLCYTVDNDSDYVLKEIWVSLPAVKSDKPQPKKTEDAPLLLPLSSPTGGFAPVGNKFVMCYDNTHFEVSKWATLTAEIESAQGWRQ